MAKSTTSTPQDSAGGRRVLGRTQSGTGGSSAGSSSRPPGGDLVSGRANAPSLLAFFFESRAELRRVTWPTRQEAMNLTIAVIGMTVAVALFLGLIDAGLDQVVTWLLSA